MLWLIGAGPIGSRPLLFLGITAVLFGTQMVATGLIAELVRCSGPHSGDKYLVESGFSGENDLSEASTGPAWGENHTEASEDSGDSRRSA